MNTPAHHGQPSELFPVFPQLGVSFEARLLGGSESPPVHGMAALLWAVLADALRCYGQQFVAHDRRTCRLAREAEAWLFCDDHHWPFSFVNICARLQLNPGYIRRGLVGWYKTRPLPIPRMRGHVVRGRGPLRVRA